MTFLLAVCMAVSLLAVPAGAANTAAVTFSDVGDKSTAVAAVSYTHLTLPTTERG